jgi:light-regulated signal transduction histidine kinase (bacteriophytochrome)
MSYVCIDRLVGEGLAAQTVAVYFDGNFEDNVRYTLKDTPCGDAVGKAICTFPKDVRDLFPKDIILRDMKAESYVGVTLWSSKGQPIGLIAVIGRKPLVNPELAEQILRMMSVRAAGELERRQDEEALKTLNQELQSTTRGLKAAYRDLESFSYAASHDLRSPLITMMGLSKIILADYAEKLDDNGKNLLSRISNKARQMEGMISDLLLFSRISAKEIRKSKFNMRALAQKLVAELKPTIGERDINFEIKQLPFAYGDRAMIAQVLRNLLSNGIKFTQTRDSAMIEIGGYTEKDENIYYVKDNGIGFDMQLSNKLFGLFQRIHSSKEVEGTGIGLVIVKNIIEKHGGRVWAEGKQDEGATFYFVLPEKKV